MIVNAKGAYAAFTVDGTNQGVVTIADTSAFYAGALCYLNGAGVDNMEVTITSIDSPTQMKVRKTGTFGYGNTDVSAFLVLVVGANITMPPQTLAGNDENYLKFVGLWTGLV